ncbi:2-keto-3-deoxy-L-rhamnonate aldolase [Paramyrothecium foliicola]|nr:2-keto-3-deoxy-L-rhamnonate aldolase [Paramyrothecium foliicola]
MAHTTSPPAISLGGKTRLRQSLERAKHRQGPSVGQWLEFPGYTLAKTVASLGEDWVLIDCEHGNIADNDMYLQIGAIASSGVSPIVRIPADEPWMMKRALDAGAHGIMVPMCETKEQAEAIVRASKYPSKEWPQGRRGAGAMFAPGVFDQNGRDYLLTANENVVICVQIETRLALENVEEIAKVDGIDMLFIGPNDLASSMGYVAFDHAKTPEVQEATQRILKATLNAGKYAGHFALSAEIAAQRYEQGFHFVNCGADIVAVSAWMSAEMNRLKQLTQDAATKEAVSIKSSKHQNVQYYTCPAQLTVPIPDSISWEEAGSIQPLAVAVQVAKRASLEPEHTVAIFGCGPLGLLVLAVCKAHGLKRIVVFDIEQSRVDFAVSYGAHTGIVPPKCPSGTDPLDFASGYAKDILAEHQLGNGFDVTIEASGAEICTQMAICMLKNGGACVQAGLTKSLASVPLFMVTANELSITGKLTTTAPFKMLTYHQALSDIRKAVLSKPSYFFKVVR